MMTFAQFRRGIASIPAATGWYLADLGEAIGQQELFTRQAPQKLKVLREHALLESTVSSNRIEGIEVEQSRIGTLIFGAPLLKDRQEEEVRGYRDALNAIHSDPNRLDISDKTILMLHSLARSGAGDAGEYKQRDGDIIQRYANGRQRIRFRPTSARQTPAAMAELIRAWHDCLQERWVHPLVALAAFNLDFLCIHPFRDGNGRVSRLLLLLQAYHLGVHVGRYISLERLIEQNKERYYETLEMCSAGWHEQKHDPWPYVNHILYILKSAYQEFERRVDETPEPRGAKTALVIAAIEKTTGTFTLSDLERACPGVSRDMIRNVLRKLSKSRKVECIGRGPQAPWRRKGNTLKRG